MTRMIMESAQPVEVERAVAYPGALHQAGGPCCLLAEGHGLVGQVNDIVDFPRDPVWAR
ncbi:hypothetical protein [Mycobacterium pseudokansasii]|uniref:hypothetical protein n=1 Tax=Mycobacterium pseudokansasii TaxID=2341080 RepID=UPI00142E90D9|nr:hypothetical protein [Mycobacterium pseudokansasii]